MKFYNDFNSIFNAQSGNSMKFVVNANCGVSGLATYNPGFLKLSEERMPGTGMGKTQLEQILVGVNKLAYRFLNDGDTLNSEENEVQLTDYYSDMLDSGEISDYDLSDGMYEPTPNAWLDEYADLITDNDSGAKPYIEKLRKVGGRIWSWSNATSEVKDEYANALADLIDYVYSRVDTYAD